MPWSSRSWREPYAQEPLDQVLQREPRLLILGEPGAGKTVLLRQLVGPAPAW